MRLVQLTFAVAFSTACNPLVSFGEEYCFEESCQATDGPSASGGTGGNTSVGGDGGTGAGASSGGSAGVSYRDVVIADSPKVYYRFGEATMSTTLASEVGGYTGTIAFENANDVQFAAAGALDGDANTAASFDGYGRFNLDAPVDFVGLAPHSIEFFMKATIPAGQYLHAIVNQNMDLGWALKFDQTTLSYTRRSSTVNDSRLTDWMANGSFQHVVVVFDGSGVTFYGRGQPTGVAQTLGNALDQYQATLRVRDGSPPNQADVTATFDELAIYDHALSWQQICNHYKCAQARENCANPVNVCDGE